MNCWLQNVWDIIKNKQTLIVFLKMSDSAIDMSNQNTMNQFEEIIANFYSCILNKFWYMIQFLQYVLMYQTKIIFFVHTAKNLIVTNTEVINFLV